MLDWALIARDGALLAAAASALIVGALRANPRFFARHFPADTRAAFRPLTPAETLAGRLVGLALVAVLFVGPYLSARGFDHAMNGQTPARALFAHAFAVGMIFNLADWLVLDEFLIGVLRPRWIVPPEAAHIPLPFQHGVHARGFAIGTILCALAAGAAVAALRLI